LIPLGFNAGAGGAFRLPLAWIVCAALGAGVEAGFDIGVAWGSLLVYLGIPKINSHFSPAS